MAPCQRWYMGANLEFFGPKFARQAELGGPSDGPHEGGVASALGAQAEHLGAFGEVEFEPIGFVFETLGEMANQQCCARTQ